MARPHVLPVATAVALVVLLVGAGFAVTVAVAEDHDTEHEHPDEVDDGGNSSAVQRWLADRLAQHHVDCTEGIRVGDFDACEDLEDDRYGSYLSRYVTVERDSTKSDDRQGERFNETRTKQAELADLLEEFHETHDDYRDARERGDQAAAREHGRELIALTQRIEALGGDVAVNFVVLAEHTDADLQTSAHTINETTEEIVLISESVERESFQATELTASVDETASFESPATVSGRLVDDDGTPITRATIEIVDDRTGRTVQTDAVGRFETTYRPTRTGVGATNLTVRYLPSSASVYLGAEVNETVDVQQTATTVSIDEATAEAGFDDEVRVAGSIRAAGTGAPGAPVTLSVDDRTVASTRTDESGGFEVAGALPAEVPTGDVEVAVGAGGADLALGPSTGSATMTVTETGTELNVSATTVDDGVRISGALLASDAGPAADRPVEITVGEETRTATTDDAGNYAVVVEPADEEREVTASYDEPRTNLGPSEATTTAPPQEDGGGAGGGPVGGADPITDLLRAYPGVAVAALGVVIFAAGAALAWWRRRDDESAASPEAPVAGADAGAAGGAAGPDVAASRSHLQRARELLATSPDDAVRAGYVAVRAGLGGDDPVRTHWEFYTDRTGDLPEDRASALRSVTEAFERATFAPGGVDRTAAAAAIEDAERCLAASDGGTRVREDPVGGDRRRAGAGRGAGDRREAGDGRSDPRRDDAGH